MKLNTHHLIETMIFVLMFLVALPASSIAQNSDEIAIRKVLDKQTKGWNSGNIEAYMQGYWESDSLVFIGKSGPKHGYKTTLQNYRKSYPDTTSMGKLNFELLQLKRLSPEYYHITGKWKLQRSIGNLEGFFTLLFRKVANNWVIILDHSS